MRIYNYSLFLKIETCIRKYILLIHRWGKIASGKHKTKNKPTLLCVIFYKKINNTKEKKKK